MVCVAPVVGGFADDEEVSACLQSEEAEGDSGDGGAAGQEHE